MSGRYKVDPEPFGEGGMATVHRAHQTSSEGFRRPVAIKYIHAALADQPDFEAQFRAEAQLIAHLHHPNIVQILDFDRDARGRLFLVMELVEGTDLRRVRNQGPMAPELAAYVVAEVLKGLAYAHTAEDEEGRALGLVHRDLSPQNVLVSWQGAVKITDFGIAQGPAAAATKTGIIKGNPGYMSPEQIEGYRLDARSDLYAVGVLLHELLLGQPLYAKPGASTNAVLAQILLDRAQPPAVLRPAVPAALSDFTMRLLAHGRAQRPATAEVALRDLLALGLVPAEAPLDLVHELQSVRRAHEKPTVVDEEAPRDVALATARMPSLETVPVADTQPGIVPLQLGRPATRPLDRWLPWFTVALAVVVAVLVVRLVKGPEARERSGVFSSVPAVATFGEEAGDVADVEPMAGVNDGFHAERVARDAGFVVPTGPRAASEEIAPRPRRARRRKVRATAEAAAAAAPMRVSVDAGPQVPEDASRPPSLLPYAPGKGLLPYKAK